MKFQDKLIRCFDCGGTFTVSAEKQQLIQSWGLPNNTKHCPSCSQPRKANRYGASRHGHSTPHQMFQVTCSECGKNTEIPFEPRTGRRVYCSDCYRKIALHR